MTAGNELLDVVGHAVEYDLLSWLERGKACSGEMLYS